MRKRISEPFQFSAVAIQAIINNGITIVVNYILQKRLTIMVYWAKQCHRLAKNNEAMLFTQEEQEAYGTMMNSEPDRETPVKEPPKFKGSVK
jgi:hypothetical protein